MRGFLGYLQKRGLSKRSIARTLSAIRDALLPKLLSGELSVGRPPQSRINRTHNENI